MRRFTRSFVLLGILLLPKFSGNATAHGTHLWFAAPAGDAVVDGQVTFRVEAPYARNPYIYLTVTREGESSPQWEGLVELKHHGYLADISLQDWQEGTYRAEVILMGGLVQHPVSTRFAVRKRL